MRCPKCGEHGAERLHCGGPSQCYHDWLYNECPECRDKHPVMEYHCGHCGATFKEGVDIPVYVPQEVVEVEGMDPQDTGGDE